MTYTITINTDNAAFEDNPYYELADILHKLATRIEDNFGGLICVKLMDSNGNCVGHTSKEDSA